MERLLSDLAEKLQLLEGDMWDKPLSKELPARVPARRIVPAKKSIKVHLGRGLHHGHHGESERPVESNAPQAWSGSSSLSDKLRPTATW